MGSLASAVLALLTVPAASTAGQCQAISSPVAFVYVSSSGDGGSRINAFAAAVNGTLTVVPGMPILANVQNMALNGKWLFGTDSVNIYTFSIASSGALAPRSSINAQQFNGYTDGGPVKLFLDHTGATLYDEDIYGNNGANNTFQFFSIDSATGNLSYMGATSSASPDFLLLSFIGNNIYAYGSSCYLSSPYIYGFSRGSGGTLTDLNLAPSIPSFPNGGYCPYLAAADPANHVAVSLTPTDGFNPVGPAQLAVYTANSAGTLSTASTYKNMPKVLVGEVTYLNMAPSGKLLAVAGTSGLQVFHFNGANPITHYTGLLTTDAVSQMFWDNANHLYAISQNAGKLYVFTVTGMTATPAPGSPHAITAPQNIIVLPKS
ncbi:MAG TPA: hypothetical protein VI386_22385 [Candidatus Sulfotelmatobacter sp.]